MATWNIDTTHTTAGFSVRHMMFTNVRGKFDGVTGVVSFDPENPAASNVEATIQSATVNTGVEDRDNHLRSADFFDVENYPEITFKSTSVEMTSDNTAKVTGDLTIRDVTQSVVLDVELTGQGKGPWGNMRAGFEASTTINREDFGLTWNQALESGGVLVGKEIKIELAAQCILVTEAETA